MFRHDKAPHVSPQFISFRKSKASATTKRIIEFQLVTETRCCGW